MCVCVYWSACLCAFAYPKWCLSAYVLVENLYLYASALHVPAYVRVSNCELTCVCSSRGASDASIMIENGRITESPLFPRREGGNETQAEKHSSWKKPAAIVVWLRTRFEPSWGDKSFTKQGNNKIVFTQVHACAYTYSVWAITQRKCHFFSLWLAGQTDRQTDYGIVDLPYQP